MTGRIKDKLVVCVGEKRALKETAVNRHCGTIVSLLPPFQANWRSDENYCPTIMIKKIDSHIIIYRAVLSALLGYTKVSKMSIVRVVIKLFGLSLPARNGFTKLSSSAGDGKQKQKHDSVSRFPWPFKDSPACMKHQGRMKNVTGGNIRRRCGVNVLSISSSTDENKEQNVRWEQGATLKGLKRKSF